MYKMERVNMYEITTVFENAQRKIIIYVLVLVYEEYALIFASKHKINLSNNKNLS